MPGLPGVPNPFQWLAGAAGQVVADGWIMAMLGLWNAGLWLLRLALNIEDAFLTPDLRENGPGSQVYGYTFWMAGSLVLVMVMIQLGAAAVRRDGKSIVTALMGTGQFCLVWSCWVGGAVTVLAGAGGLTRALMTGLLGVRAWSAWHPFHAVDTTHLTDGTVATVLGGMGCLLWLAAIGHLLVMLTRAGALVVLATTTPLSAAGLVSDVGRAWFWKSLRWFLAAAFTPVLMVLVLGIGVQLTTGVATGTAGTTQAAIGTAVPSVILVLIACFCPLALFKLLAFVDPGTTSGAALRSGLDAQGGLQGLLSGNGGSDDGSAMASSADQNGTSQGEATGQDSTAGRYTKGQSGTLQAAGAALGGMATAGLGAVHSAGTRGAAIGADLSNQMGVGHSTHHPDIGATTQRNNRSGTAGGESGGGDTGGNGGGDATPDAASGPLSGPSTGPAQSTDSQQALTTPGHAAQGTIPPAPTAPGTPGTSPTGDPDGPKGSPRPPKGGTGGSGGAGGAGAAGGAGDAAVVAV
ncbi:hypothetical protein [Allobranchiibius sp. CTAmp26]|uniref:hypothetical protein n=1 Tax=Allobranchiibius sp. CTAmp26 TaxID=2815214 RepID=UPI001AA17301|nr:hypothetical protein [Allobranchiibius sp. CTAmp26]MBO1756474.1 hypothetical protein [Allobranchiibius sp. CTAmp26]